MGILEQEIIAKFHQLDAAAQQRVRDILLNEFSEQEVFNFDKWVADVQAIRQEIRSEHDGQYPMINGVDMLRDIRDSEDE